MTAFNRARRRLSQLALVFTAVGLVACSTDETAAPAATTLTVQRYNNLNAPGDPGIFDPMTGMTTVTGYQSYTLFNLRTGQPVAIADSNSSNWDIAFKTTRIIVNGGFSGPGQGRAVVLADLFDNITTAPDDATLRQDVAPRTTGANYAIVASGNTAAAPFGWYTFAMVGSGASTFSLITPTPGRTIVIKCANGQYAKLRILSYYQNAPDPATVTAATPSRYYTFEWVVAPAGSRTLN